MACCLDDDDPRALKVVLVAFALACVLAVAWAIWIVAAAQPAPVHRTEPTDGGVLRWVEPAPAAVPRVLPAEADGGVSFAGSGSLTITDGRAWGATIALAGSADACPICSRSLARDPFTSEPNIVLWDREGRDAFRGCYDCLIAAVTTARR